MALAPPLAPEKGYKVGSSFTGAGSLKYGRIVFFPAGHGAGLAVLHLLPLHMAHGSQGTLSRRKRKLTVGIVYCREVAGLDDSLSSCMRQVEERYRVEERYYRVEEPERVGEQSIAFGLR